MKLECLTQFTLTSPVQALRIAIYEDAERTGLIMVHANTPDQQPGMGDIHWPNDTLKISAFTLVGEHQWTYDVGPGVMPGLWFCPVFPFDLDGDGVDEIYHVGNPSGDHPFNLARMELTALNANSGKVLRQVPWPWFPGQESMSDTFRYLINGGYSRGTPRLVTAQGCYHELTIQAWDGELNLLWQRHIPDSEPGCRASHMFPVLDIDGDGRDEVFLGERCIDIDTGEDKWVADRDGYHGHSDIVMPTFDRQTGRWMIYTCREFPWPEGSRGVVMFDDHGREIWGHRGMGHMHNGWTARFNDDGSHLCYAMEVSKKKEKGVVTELNAAANFLYDLSGKPVDMTFPLSDATPIDIDGDGRHELVSRNGRVFDRHGNEVGRVRGNPGTLPKSKLLDCPGEQILTNEAGTIRIFGCPDATDAVEAKARYAHPYYKSCQRLTAVGYNWHNLGGL